MPVQVSRCQTREAGGGGGGGGVFVLLIHPGLFLFAVLATGAVVTAF